MKQHITIDQLNELSDKAKGRLKKWWKPETSDAFSGREFFGNDYITYYANLESDEMGTYQDKVDSLPLLSIGQMIEFLGDDCNRQTQAFVVSDYIGNNKLCDDLWQAVKEMLEKEIGE